MSQLSVTLCIMNTGMNNSPTVVHLQLLPVQEHSPGSDTMVCARILTITVEIPSQSAVQFLQLPIQESNSNASGALVISKN